MVARVTMNGGRSNAVMIVALIVPQATPATQAPSTATGIGTPATRNFPRITPTRPTIQPTARSMWPELKSSV